MNKRLVMLLCVLIISIFILPSFSFATTYQGNNVDSGNKSSKNNRVVAYYTSWSIYDRNFQVTSIDGSKITHINYAFANIKDGKIEPGDQWADIEKPFPGGSVNGLNGNFGELLKLKEKYPNLQTLISVGGWSWSENFSDAALNNESRQLFAESAVKFIRDYGFDGVDLDWEYPVSGGEPDNINRPEDKENYTLLLQEIRTALDQAGKEDGKNYLLTIAGGASKSFIENTELNKIAEICDWVNIMTYDFHGSWENVSGHNSPLYNDVTEPVSQAAGGNVNASVAGYLEAGVPSAKLVLGIPFYGKGWTGCDIKAQGQYQQCEGPTKEGTWEKAIYDFTDLEENYIGKNGYGSYWNGKAKVPYLFNKKTGTFITYENEKSIGYKTDYVEDLHLGGAMIWEISGDRNKILLDRIATDLLN